MADIPGLIEGAAEGAGLGVRFLKHLARTRLLLHVLDVEPADGGDPVAHAQAIANELEQFSPALAGQERWLVLNKLDLIPEDLQDELCQGLVQRLGWDGPVFRISAATGTGTQELIFALMNAIEERRLREQEDPDYAVEQQALREQLEREARERMQLVRAEARLARLAKQRLGDDDDDDFDDDDHDVEIVYKP